MVGVVVLAGEVIAAPEEGRALLLAADAAQHLVLEEGAELLVRVDRARVAHDGDEGRDQALTEQRKQGRVRLLLRQLRS